MTIGINAKRGSFGVKPDGVKPDPSLRELQAGDLLDPGELKPNPQALASTGSPQ